jgi:3-(3-hydroxy-phenyl)propionate hydroxylase
LKTYTNPRYPYRRCAEQDGEPRRHRVAIVGAGPVGLALAIDLAQRGVEVVVLDDDDTVSVGSRAICYAKRSLDILDRLGVGQRIVDKGVRWSVGKVFFGDELAYRFDLDPEASQCRPAFVNLQQYWLEQFLVERACELPQIDLRWKHKVVGVDARAEGVEVDVETADGTYRLACEWLVACDGARSPVRHMLGLEAQGQVFHDRFLIADIHMRSHFPTERWFWFDPPFHRGQSVLLHRQADDVWRVDFQLGWDADPDTERQPQRILPRLRAMLGPDALFDIEWASVYTFQCRRLDRFLHGRVIFAGDSAHVVSPFGARGANGGFQDADNLAWKLALVVHSKAPPALLESYDRERMYAADENLRNSTRSTDFITPKSHGSRVLRDAVLQLARRHVFARTLVNSGRLSVPAILEHSALNTPDDEGPVNSRPAAMRPGAPAADAPVNGPRGGWLLRHIGPWFTLLVFNVRPSGEAIAALAAAAIPCEVLRVAPANGGDEGSIVDTSGLVARRYDARDGTAILLRPDQHVCARWRHFDVACVQAAIARATANDSLARSRCQD